MSSPRYLLAPLVESRATSSVLWLGVAQVSVQGLPCCFHVPISCPQRMLQANHVCVLLYLELIICPRNPASFDWGNKTTTMGVVHAHVYMKIIM